MWKKWLKIFSYQFKLVKSRENKTVLSSQQKAPTTGLQSDLRKKYILRNHGMYLS